MGFKIAARTLLHLGSELISSDGIALYELIKNSYDAGSPIVRVTVMAALPRSVQRHVLDTVAATGDPGRPTPPNTATLRRLREACTEALVAAAPNVGEVRDALGKRRTLADLAAAVRDANRLVVADDGRGMSMRDLDSAFLTIGTRSKLVEKAEGGRAQPILGEKGIGRLSALRLGERLRLRSATKRDVRWATLDVDWSIFDHDNDQDLSSIPVTPAEGEKKLPTDVSGTMITISALRREWGKPYLQELALREFARLNDPFREAAGFPIVLKHNADPLQIPRVDEWIFDHAHARCRATFEVGDDGAARLSGTMSYGRVEDSFLDSEVQLFSSSEAPSVDVVRSIGPFEVEFLWYNRRILREMEGVGNMQEVREKLAIWTGGLMMYRNGFRVLPYGGSNDDWLDLDRRALARSGFKLNRAQIVGRVAITQRGNLYVIEDARLEPFLDQAEHARVGDPVVQESAQPILADFVKERPDVRIQDVVHLCAGDPDAERVQRIVLAALWPKPVREPKEIFLVDPVQHRHRGPLDDLILQGRDRERALSPVRLRNEPSPGRLRPIGSSLDPPMQIVDPAIEIGLVGPPRQPVHADGRVSLESEERRPQHGRVEVVEERGEPFRLPASCRFPYTRQHL